MLPEEYLNLDTQSKAFIIASLQVRSEAEEEQAEKIKRNSKVK